MSQKERTGIRKTFQNVMKWIRRGFRKEPEPPLDPYAYVTAPRKPRPSGRNAAAVAELEE